MSRSILPPSCDPHERVAPPTVVEDGDGWLLFGELQESADRTFRQTQQVEADLYEAPDQVLHAPKLADVMAIARRNHRSSPVPSAWVRLHALLPVRFSLRGRVPAPPPLVGFEHLRTSAMQKRLRLREQIEWAQKTGALIAVYDYLRTLPEPDWEHF